MMSVDDARAYGERVEIEFVERCTRSGMAAHRFQYGRNRAARIRVGDVEVISPDIGLWDGKSSLHEIKAKYPTSDGYFGLEKYRLDHYEKLMSKAPVFYTIKVTARGDSGNAAINKWCPAWNDRFVTTNFEKLMDWLTPPEDGPSLVDGIIKTVPIHYWEVELWEPYIWHPEWSGAAAVTTLVV